MKKYDLADIVLIVLVIFLAVGGVAYMIHKGNAERDYAERNSCEWRAVGGLSVCK